MKKIIMNKIDAIVLEVLYRSLRVLYRKDNRVKEEIESWNKNLSLKLICGPGGPVLALRKSESRGVHRMQRAQRADITMRFKSVNSAFKVLTGQMGVSQAYAEHQFSLEGDIFQTMSFVRCVEYAEAYLFPGFWSSRILKAVPDKQMSSVKVYLMALLER